MKLKMIEAKTGEDFEAMRIIRNECASYMTGSTAQISRDEQILWLAPLDRTLVRPFVFETVQYRDALDVQTDRMTSVRSTAVIGYGLCRKLPRYDGTWWVSGGLLPNWRGQGLGKELFSPSQGLAPFIR